MMFRRFALYYMPPAQADWTVIATSWLGWDAASGADVAQPDLPALPLPVNKITKTPRKYGLHATIKPPFALAQGTAGADVDALSEACATLCAGLKPVTLEGLEIAQLGPFLALRPQGDVSALNQLAAACVEGLDRFRAPASEAELTRRRASGLSPEQDALLLRWGYPYVMDQFRFHITLSGRLQPEAGRAVKTALDGLLGPHLPRPFTLDTLALAGEAEDGRFHLIHRYPLAG